MKAILFLLLAFPCLATSYYVRSDGGTGNGLTDGTAWDIATLTSSSLQAGDIVNFKRGNTFTSSPVPQSGVTYQVYGTGANPVFTALQPLATWTSVGNNIYYASLDVAELNVLVIDGAMRPMGRYPKTGALYYTTHGYSYLKGSSVTSLPFDPTGYEIVLNKIEQVTDRHFIQSRSADTLKLVMGGGYHTNQFVNTGWGISDGMPYFIQNGLGCLTQNNDWYYDRTTKRVYVYLSDNPAGHTIRSASRDAILQLENLQNVTFKGLDFEGANVTGLQTYGSNRNVTLLGCNVRYCGNGLRFDGPIRNLLVRGGSLQYLANNGIATFDTARRITIDSVYFHNVGKTIGAGASSDFNQLAVVISGDSNSVTRCQLDSVGYHGVVLHGNYTTISDNNINCPCLTKRDCAGVYDYQFTTDRTDNTPPIQSRGQLIARNLITNVYARTDNLPINQPNLGAHGVYLDAAVNNTAIVSNTAVNGSNAGFFVIDVGGGNSFVNNRSDNWGLSGLQIVTASRALRNLTVTGNSFSGRISSQLGIYYLQYNTDNVNLYGTFSGNTYNNSSTDYTIRVERNGVGATTYRLGQFKSAYAGLETGSLSNVRLIKDSLGRFQQTNRVYRTQSQ